MTRSVPRVGRAVHRAVAVVIIGLGLVIAASLLWTAGPSGEQAATAPRQGSNIPAPATPDALIATSEDARAQLSAAVLRAMAGLEIAGASEARRVGVEYVLSLAEFSADRARALGDEVGAAPDAEFMAHQRQLLANVPERIKPEGWDRLDDRELLSWAFGMLRLARWAHVDHEGIRSTHFEKGRAHAPIDEYFMMNPPPGYERSGSSLPIFPMPGLIQKARMSLVDVVMLQIDATLERGDQQRFRILLAEYEPGRWYPAGYRSDIVRVPTLHGATRAPRPQ